MHASLSALALALGLAGCPGAQEVGPMDVAAGGDVDASPDAAPLRVCDPRAHGAAGDGTTKDTHAIQAAIDECAAAGGGIVRLADGRFLSGTLRLASHLVLEITPTATLLGSKDAADYPELAPPFTNTQLNNCRRALVYAGTATDVQLRGGGTIDGNARGVADWNGNKIKEALRPMAVFAAGTRGVVIEDLTVKHAATWAVVVMEVQDALLRRLVVDTDLGPTHDGIDIVDGHDVVVEDVDVTSGDDSICLKSGSQTGTRRVVVRRAHTRQSGVANGVKFGTASVGPFDDILIEDVVIENAQSAAMAVESVDGSAISNVTFRRITTNNVGTPFFVLLGSRDRDPARVGSIDGVTFDQITGTNMRYAWGSIITGTIVGTQTFGIRNLAFSNIDLTFRAAGNPATPTPFTDDNFPEYQGPVPGAPGKRYNQYPDAKFIAGTDGRENISYRGPGWGVFLRHATGVSFTNCRMSAAGADARPWRDTKDTANITGTCQ